MAAKRSKSGALERAKVMVVDARGDELGGVCEHLTQMGLKVVELKRPEAAVPLYRFFRPDAAVLATTAPSFSEVALGKQLRFVSGGSLPLFYVVDQADSFSRTYVMRKGYALDVFTRPVNAEELAAKIEANVRLKCSIERLAAEQGDARGAQLRDELTGLAGRAYFLEGVGAELRRCERYGGSFTLVACRVEGISRLRRSLGREQVDRILAQAGAALAQSAREADLAARVGESELALLLTKCPAESAEPVLARILAGLEAARLSFQPSRRPGFSLGAVSFPDVPGTALQLLAAAMAQARRQRPGTGTGLVWGGWRGSSGEERDV